MQAKNKESQGKTRWIWLKNNLIPEDQAVISVRERGFRFGDGVFETLRIDNSKLYQWDSHIKRLQLGLKELHISFDISTLKASCKELLAKNGLKQGLLRISISRGIGSRGYLPQVKGEPTLVIETEDLPPPLPSPIKLWVSEYIKPSFKGVPTGAKLMQGLLPTLARLEAAEHQCFESLLLNEKGHICEASSSNIFWLEKDILHTPALSTGALPGTVREAVLNLSPWKVKEGEYPLEALHTAEEIFLTNTAYLVIPVGSLQPKGLRWAAHEAAKTLTERVQQDIHAA